jgi:hypothetical protein
MNDTERQKFADKMRLAGFPACAGPDQFKASKALSGCQSAV